VLAIFSSKMTESWTRPFSFTGDFTYGWKGTRGAEKKNRRSGIERV